MGHEFNMLALKGVNRCFAFAAKTLPQFSSGGVTLSHLFLFIYYQMLQILTMKPYHNNRIIYDKNVLTNSDLRNNSVKYGKM